MVALYTAIMGISVATIILILVRKDRLHASSAITWIAMSWVFVFLGLAPATFDSLAKYLGISYPPALAFSIAICATTVKLLVDDIAHAKLRTRQDRIIQRIALLEMETRTQSTDRFSSSD